MTVADAIRILSAKRQDMKIGIWDWCQGEFILDTELEFKAHSRPDGEVLLLEAKYPK